MFSNVKPDVLVFFLLCFKHHGQKETSEENHLQRKPGRNSSRNLEAGTEAEAMEECFLPCSPGLA